MGERAYRDAVDFEGGEFGESFERHASGDFRSGLSGDGVGGAAELAGAHVVEQNDVDWAVIEYLADFGQVARLDRYLQAAVAVVFADALERRADAARRVDVVVFDQVHVVERESVVFASAGSHGMSLERSPERGGLAGVDHPDVAFGMAEHVDVVSSEGGYAREALEKIEHEPLGGQNRARVTGFAPALVQQCVATSAGRRTRKFTGSGQCQRAFVTFGAQVLRWPRPIQPGPTGLHHAHHVARKLFRREFIGLEIVLPGGMTGLALRAETHGHEAHYLEDFKSIKV